MKNMIRLVWLCLTASLFYVVGCSSSSQGSGGTPGSENGDQRASSGTEGSSGSGGSGSAGGATAGTSSGNGLTGSGASGGGPSGSGSTTSGSSTGSSSSSGSTGSTVPEAEGGLTTTDGAPQNDPDIDYSVAPVTLTMSTFTVSANQEVYYCQNFANPWGKQVDIKVYSLDMGVGSHHMFAFYQSGATNGALAQCPEGGFEFGAFTFVSQSPQRTVDFPPSIGATIPAGTGFQLMVHYLNTSSSTITSSLKLTMYVAKAGAVTQHAGVLFLSNGTMTVAATCTNGCASSETYTLPQDVYVLSTEGHMHKYGTNFVTTVSPAGDLPNGQLYQTNVWDEPMQTQFSPPAKLAKGSTVTWTCTDVNNTGQLLTFGQSAVKNVMCISQSIIYPVTDVDNPVIGSGGGGL
jgi:hypothetical protein